MTEIIEQYNNGASERDLARKYKCSHSTIRKHLIKSGIIKLPNSLLGVKTEVIERYKQGDGIRKLCLKYHLQDYQLKRLLIDEGIFRTASDAQYLRWSQSTPKQVKQRALQHAITVQRLGKLSRLEKLFARALQDAEIKAIPQYALDVFNIDFAIPDIKLAIEIDGRWHGYTPRLEARDNKKEQYLKEHGWTLLRIRDKRNCPVNAKENIELIKPHLPQ